MKLFQTLGVPSPCVKLCRVDQCGICVGCWRTCDEIARWMEMDDSEKTATLALLDERRLIFSEPKRDE